MLALMVGVAAPILILATVGVATDGIGSPFTAALAGALFLFEYGRPLIVYSGPSSEAVAFDEGALLVMIALLPVPGVILTAAAASAVVQIMRRRQLVKASFNVSQIVIVTAVGARVAQALGYSRHHITWSGGLALVAATIVLSGLSTLLIGIMLDAAGAQRLSSLWRYGLRTRALMLACAVSTGLVCAVAAANERWTLFAVPVVFYLLRRAFRGHFAALHDRDRVVGMLDGAREIHGAMADGTVRTTIEQVASRVLRGDAKLQIQPPPDGALAAPLPDDSGWLAVSGRSAGEPFDEADRRLLSTLTALGAGALTNQALYSQVNSQRRQIETVLSSLAEGVCAFDAHARATFWNPAAEQLLGFSARSFDPTQPVSERLIAPVRRCLQTGIPLNASATFLRADLSTMPVSYTCAPIQDGDHVIGAVLAFRDDTERLEYERQLSHHAFHDQLTGLANRRLFLDRLDQALRRANRHDTQHAVLYADVDRFKMINDSLGHRAGDRLLTEISTRLRELVRDSDTIARFGGDEFTLLLEDIADTDVAETLAQRICEVLEQPIQVTDDRRVLASVSIGIAIAHAGDNADDLLHDADLAMYEAKADGPGRWHRYRVALGARSAEQLDLEAELRAALGDGSLEVHYQPLIDTWSEQPVDFEALVRWQHPHRGVLTPEDFIPLAEETGLILSLGEFVLRQACADARQWIDERKSSAGISVNLSAKQFHDADLVGKVRGALAESRLPAERLCLEITETLAMRDIDWTLHTLRRLKEIGVRLAIDDFGTGYSSLSYLKLFPVDIVKIDRCFIRDLEHSVVDSAIVNAVVTIARTLQIVAVAEGVETVSQLAYLRKVDCPVVQGYLYSTALPVDELSEWMTLMSASPNPRGRVPRQRESGTTQSLDLTVTPPQLG